VGARYRQLFMTTTVNTDQFGMTGVASVDLDSGRVDRLNMGRTGSLKNIYRCPRLAEPGSGCWVWLAICGSSNPC
jgi:carotenoid cleavage dioxygenase